MSAGFDWFQPGDLPAFFKALRKSPHPAILVGGQSLTFWVDFFNIPIPEIATPYLTQWKRGRYPLSKFASGFIEKSQKG